MAFLISFPTWIMLTQYNANNDPSEEALAFFKAETGIDDGEELENHILEVSEKTFAVSSRLRPTTGSGILIHDHYRNTNILASASVNYFISHLACVFLYCLPFLGLRIHEVRSFCWTRAKRD
jgi:hypothetical protein